LFINICIYDANMPTKLHDRCCTLLVYKPIDLWLAFYIMDDVTVRVPIRLRKMRAALEETPDPN
jgi:hypothetical protein